MTTADFEHELRATVARLSDGYSYNDVDPEHLASAKQMDTALDAAIRRLDGPDGDDHQWHALDALRVWESAWARCGEPR